MTAMEMDTKKITALQEYQNGLLNNTITGVMYPFNEMIDRYNKEFEEKKEHITKRLDVFYE